MGTGIYAGFQQGVFDQVRTAGLVSGDNHKKLLLGIRPYVKKYISPTRLTPYLQGYLSYDRIMAGAGATNSFYAGGDFGLAYLLGKNWLIEGKLLGLSAIYSKTPNSKTDVATVYGRKLLSANLDAGFKPVFTVAYVFR